MVSKRVSDNKLPSPILSIKFENELITALSYPNHCDGYAEIDLFTLCTPHHEEKSCKVLPIRVPNTWNWELPDGIFFRFSVTRRKPNSVFSAGPYSQQSMRGAPSDDGNIPCKNYRRLHKHKTFAQLQQCDYQARLDNALSDVTSNREATPSLTRIRRISDIGKISSSPTNLLTRDCRSRSVSRRNANETPDEFSCEVKMTSTSSSDSPTTENECSATMSHSHSQSHSRTRTTSHTSTTSTSTTSKVNILQSGHTTSASVSASNTTQESSKVAASNSNSNYHTMERFVEKFYAPSKVIANPLPKLARDKRILESFHGEKTPPAFRSR